MHIPHMNPDPGGVCNLINKPLKSIYADATNVTIVILGKLLHSVLRVFFPGGKMVTLGEWICLEVRVFTETCSVSLTL